MPAESLLGNVIPGLGGYMPASARPLAISPRLRPIPAGRILGSRPGGSSAPLPG